MQGTHFKTFLMINYSKRVSFYKHEFDKKKKSQTLLQTLGDGTIISFILFFRRNLNI